MGGAGVGGSKVGGVRWEERGGRSHGGRSEVGGAEWEEQGGRGAVGGARWEKPGALLLAQAPSPSRPASCPSAVKRVQLQGKREW